MAKDLHETDTDTIKQLKKIDDNFHRIFAALLIGEIGIFIDYFETIINSKTFAALKQVFYITVKGNYFKVYTEDGKLIPEYENYILNTVQYILTPLREHALSKINVLAIHSLYHR